MFGSAIVPLFLAASALATVFITNPISTTTLPAGTAATVSWIDDGNAPSLFLFGNASIIVYVGNALQQTPLQTIAANVNVSQISSVTYTPDPTIGPNSNEYFIRVTSLSYMNPSSPQYPEEAFSAKFSLSGMSGTFNSTVQAEINGQSTAPIGGATSVAVGTGSATGAATTPAAASTAAKASSTASSKSTNGAAKPVMATGLVALIAALVGASFL